MKKLNDAQAFMANELTRDHQRPVYCRYCGKDVKHPTDNSGSDWKQALDWEIHNNAHVKCHQLYLYNM